MMETTNLTGNETQAKTFQELLCSPALGGALKQLAIFSSAVNILLSMTAFFGNSLVLVALHKESSLHPPSKLLYRCLATTDLLAGLLAHPLVASLWISVVHKHWSICRFVLDASLVTSYVLHFVSLMTTTAISVDRLLALLLGLRYRQNAHLCGSSAFLGCPLYGHPILSVCSPYTPLVGSYPDTVLLSNLSRFVY